MSTQPPKPALPTLAARLSKIHVLLVDDDPEVREVVGSLLRQLGFEHTTIVESVSDAIGLLKNRRPERGIDLVITDWLMSPDDGLDLIRFIRTSPDCANPYLPIILLSGYLEWIGMERPRDAGVNEIVPKPFIAKMLCDKIIQSFDNPREFISTATYNGPSRRRKNIGLPAGVNTDRRKLRAVNTLVGNPIKAKIGHDVSMQQIIPLRAVQTVQAYLDSRADNYREWTFRDIAEIQHACNNIKLGADLRRHIKKISKIAFSIKCHAGTYGYKLASDAARSLYNICEYPFKTDEHQLIVIEKHVEVLQTIFQHRLQGSDHPVAKELLQGLQALIQKYRKLPE